MSPTNTRQNLSRDHWKVRMNLSKIEILILAHCKHPRSTQELMATAMRRTEELVLVGVIVVTIEAILRIAGEAEGGTAAVPEVGAASIAIPLEVAEEAAAAAGIVVGELAIGEEDAGVINRWTMLAGQVAAAMGAGRVVVGISNRIMTTAPCTVGTLIIRPFQLSEVEGGTLAVERVQVEVYRMGNRREVFIPCRRYCRHGVQSSFDLLVPFSFGLINLSSDGVLGVRKQKSNLAPERQDVKVERKGILLFFFFSFHVYHNRDD